MLASSASTLDNEQWQSFAVPNQCNQAGIDLIKKFEGFIPHVYLCAGGYPTIGYGHLLKEGESFEHDITEEQAEALLRDDIAVAERAVRNLIAVPLNSNQFSALVSFTFNLGSGALQASTLRKRVNAKHYDDVPYQLQRWCYAGGVKLNGLIKRREAEAALWCKA